MITCNSNHNCNNYGNGNENNNNYDISNGNINTFVCA